MLYCLLSTMSTKRTFPGTAGYTHSLSLSLTLKVPHCTQSTSTLTLTWRADGNRQTAHQDSSHTSTTVVRLDSHTRQPDHYSIAWLATTRRNEHINRDQDYGYFVSVMKSKTLPPTTCSLGVCDLDPDVDLARWSVTVTGSTVLSNLL